MIKNLRKFKKFKSPKELFKRLFRYTDAPKKGGVVVGIEKAAFGGERVRFIEDDAHALCIGSTRSGKSRTVVLQTIGLQALSGECIICSDPKGELHHYTYPFLERLGYKVYTLDFKHPLKSAKYNFLQNVIDAVNAGDIPKAIEYSWDLTSAMVGEPKGERIWNDGEASIIASSILAVVYDNRNRPDYQNLTNVYYFIAEMCKQYGDYIPLNAYVEKLLDTHPAKALLGISGVAPDRTRGSFFTAALTTLRLFTNPYIYNMTNKSEFETRKISEEKTAVFIVLPDEKTTYYSLASLFVNQLYESLVATADERGGRLKRRVNFNLDEFGNFIAIPMFITKLTVGGGRGIRFNLFIQSVAQLEEKYSKTVQSTILGNCHTWIYLRSDEPETQRLISEKLGNYTVAAGSHSTSYNGGGFSQHNMSASSNLTARPLLTPDEVGKINRPFSLIMTREYPAVLRSPDISKTFFNKMFGMGNEEHNTVLREMREEMRPVYPYDGKMALWGVWLEYKPKPQKSSAPKWKDTKKKDEKEEVNIYDDETFEEDVFNAVPFDGVSPERIGG